MVNSRIIILLGSSILILCGLLGILLNNKSPIRFLLSVELTLFGINRVLTVLSIYYNTVLAQLLVFLILTVAAAEVAIGLGLIVAVSRAKETVYFDYDNQTTHK